MNEQELNALAARARRAGHDSITEYALVLVKALARISDANSGPWGHIAHEALTGRRPGPQWTLRAVAQRGHDQIDAQLDDALDESA